MPSFQSLIQKLYAYYPIKKAGADEWESRSAHKQKGAAYDRRTKRSKKPEGYGIPDAFPGKEGILADFLSSQRAEVIVVSIFEYNEEEEMRKIRASEYKSGKEDGIVQGIKQGMELGIEGTAITCKELGLSFEQTVEKLKLRFHLSEQEAQEKVHRYWN